MERLPAEKEEEEEEEEDEASALGTERSVELLTRPSSRGDERTRSRRRAGWFLAAMMELIRVFEVVACCTIVIWSCPPLIDAESPPAGGGLCWPNPCQNGALCRLRGDGYSCFCVPGFQGVHCHIDVNECASQPCLNGATCADRPGSYLCLCPPAFAGVTCEVQIDECQSQPCLNGGSCHDDAGGFTCTCSPGFQGRRCETNTDECQEGPCQNGAVCIDGLNEYRCDCSHTAFTGPRCQTPLPLPPPPPPCASQPCFNSAICQDTQGNYTCHCWPGFEGRRCELDISECSSGPCAHGGRCLERSWGHLYGSEPLLPGLYDPHRAAGYVCSCPPGTTGSHCQEVTKQCDPNPCRNGGLCESRAGGWVCHCAEPAPGATAYGGPRCNVTLVGCQGHECQNHRSCSPFLLDGVHGYTCSCRPGFTGPLCKTPTTFSFERSGYLLLQSPPLEAQVACDVTLSFKTVMPEALLFRRRSRGLLLTLELRAGRLRLSLGRESPGAADGAPHLLELPANVTDGEWHSVEARLGDWLLSLKLLDQDGGCDSRSCRRSAAAAAATAATAAVPRDVAGPLPTPQTTLVGGVQRDGGGAAAAPPAFVGCMRDVFVDFQLMVPEEWLSHSAVNVSPGCSHRDRCLESPCQNGGECVNLWQSYRCRCPRPYEGQDCEEEHVTARFGSDDAPSHAVFAVTDDLGADLSVSLFLRTRRRRGLLLALANSSGDYLRLWLEEGRVRAGPAGSPGLGALASAAAVSDGEVHFVSLEVANGRMALHVAAQKQGQAEVGAVEVRAGDAVYVGGLAGSAQTAALGGYFKGCIQDLRLNQRRLQFFGLDASPPTFPLRRMESVTAGCSGDPTCGSNPCLNGGMCYSIWDDFTCKCPPSTAGRRCEEVRWCELSPCPPEAECRMLNHGYECHANATFLDNSTVLLYRGNGNISRNLTSLSLRLRTRKRNAAILHAEQGAAFVTVSVQDGFLFMELQSSTAAAGEEEEEEEEEEEDGEGEEGEAGVGGVSTVSLSSVRSVSDGEWHGVQLFMATPWAAASHWTLVLDEEVDEASTSRSQGGNLDFLREGVDIYLGGLAPEAGWALTGCLGTVELGGLALSYLDASQVNLPRLQPERFLLAAGAADAPPLLGCSGAPVCRPDPCLNGGLCQDLFNSFSCSCADGWSGRRCDFLTDTCASGPCVHGNCSVHGRTYECACDFGYAGADCEEEVDVCQNHLCAHGATCLHGPDRYACLCAENYTGPLCNDRVEEIPWYIVVKRVRRPKLPVSVCGDDTRNYTCFNGGNCTDRELSCDCPPGFAGHRCEQDVDECRSNPCLNGGYCRNHINRFSCVCDMSFAGEVCQTDVSDLYFYVAVLLWQNLFQLLSYLILRLDDEPEIDWGENL